MSENKMVDCSAELWLNGSNETRFVDCTGTDVTVRGRDDAARLDWLEGEGNFERAWRTFMRSGFSDKPLTAREAIDEERALDERGEERDG